MKDIDWVRRRWFDFRNGHTIYLIFVMAFLQFVIITYALAIERFALLEQIFPTMWMWSVFFIAIYVPSAVIIGHFHRKHQMPTEAKQNIAVNPYTYQAMPGKERLYNLRMNHIFYELQLKNMEMYNAMVGAISEVSGKPLPKWDKQDFEIVKESIYITERLEKGDNVIDIYDDLQNRNRANDAKGLVDNSSSRVHQHS